MKNGSWVVKRLLVIFAVSISILMGTVFCMFLFLKVDVSAEGRGVVKCGDWLDVRTGIKGVIKTIHVKEGQWVAKGTLLFELEERELELDVEEAKYLIESQKSQINRIELQLESMKLSVKAAIDVESAKVAEANAKFRIVQKGPKAEEIILAKDNIKIADEKLSKALRDTKRMERAFALNLVSRQDYEEALHGERLAQINSKTAWDDLNLTLNKYNLDDVAVAKAQWEGAKAQREKVLIRDSETFVLDAELEQARSALKREERRLDVYRQRLVLSSVRAPIDGYVLTHDPDHLVGQSVQEGTVVVRLGDCRNYVVDCRIPERDTPLVSIGQSARVQIIPFPKGEYRLLDATVIGVGADVKDMLPAERGTETMSAMSSALNEGYFSVLLELQKPYSIHIFGETYSIKPGYSTEVSIITSTHRLAILLIRKVLRIRGDIKTHNLHQ